MSVISERVWRRASFVVLLVAAILRLYDLNLKPLHSDEGVNGFFVTRLFHEGFYQYDPANYHGPTLYYFALFTSTANSLFFGRHGLSTFAIRLVPVLFGIATVWLVLQLRREVGAIGALAAAALVGVSPGCVYFSRDFIHETPFAFFTLALVVAALRYSQSAQPVYLMLASASAALLFATKETAVISSVVLLLALLCTVAYVRLRKPGRPDGAPVDNRPRRDSRPVGNATAVSRLRSRLDRFGGTSHLVVLSLVAILLFLNGIVLFYSSFFSQPRSVHAAAETFRFWVKASQTAHRHPWYEYLRWLGQEELPLLLLGATGAALAVWRACNRFALFAGLWAIGLLAAYSLVPYKTPWLTLNFLVPLAITGGYAVEVIAGMGGQGGKVRGPKIALALVAAALSVSAYQAIRLNFYHYDDDRYPYVYAQTRRAFLGLVEQIHARAARAGTGEQTTVTITSPDYWPLPWYLREYKNVAYHGRINAPNEAIVIGSEKQEPLLLLLLAGKYQRIDSYPLRPGVNLVLFVRRAPPGP